MREKIRYYYYFYFFFFFKYFSVKKFANLFLALAEFVLRKETLKSRPFIASIDPANSCILHCPLCPTGRGDGGIKKEILAFSDFKKYFDQIKDYLFFVRLYNWGEPFLAKDIFKMVDYAHQNNVGVVVNSNLNFIPKNLAQKIVSNKLDYLEISIDGVSQETYEKYRRRGNIDKVFETIRQINNYKKIFKSKLPILHWSFLLNKYNRQDVLPAQKLAQKLGFNLITFLPLSMITKVNEKFSEKNKNYWLGEKLASQKGETEPSYACYFLWTSININPQGLVFPCCGIFEDKYVFGDLQKKDFAEIWNNEKFQMARGLFGKKPSNRKCFTVCQQCCWFKKSTKGKI